jgi:hypothetical protein
MNSAVGTARNKVEKEIDKNHNVKYFGKRLFLVCSKRSTSKWVWPS